MPVFISHDMDDRAEYDTLVAGLKQAGLTPWDPNSMSVGASLADQLEAGIRSCDSCVFLVTKNSVESAWCFAETGAFWGAGKKLVAFLADATTGTAKLPPMIREDLAASDIPRLVKFLKNESLQDAAGKDGVLFFMSGASQDSGKRFVIQSALQRQFREVHALVNLDDDQLEQWKGLFLGIPYEQTITPQLIDRIVRWVRDGGRLVVCGFELGERHHETNLNQLAYHFGIAFNGDVIVRARAEGETESAYLRQMRIDKGYDDPLRYEHLGADPDLLDGVHGLTIANACSLHLEPGARPLILARPNCVSELTVGSGKYSAPPAFKLAAGAQIFDPPYLDERRAIGAVAPKDLTLKGSVLALGSWDFRDGAVPHDNARFLQNLRQWLKG